MKKLYFLTLAAAVSFSASAANHVTLTKAESLGKTTKTIVRTQAPLSSQPKRAAAASDYAGYEWTELGQGKYKASVLADTYGGSTEVVDVTIYEATRAFIRQSAYGPTWLTMANSSSTHPTPISLSYPNRTPASSTM